MLEPGLGALRSSTADEAASPELFRGPPGCRTFQPGGNIQQVRREDLL